MSLKHGLLGLLRYREMTGYELSRVFKDSLAHFWQAQTSQIYRELNNMEEKGWTASRVELQTDKPNKRIYSITQPGVQEFEAWMHSAMPDEFLPTRSDFLMRVFFSAAVGVPSTCDMLETVIGTYISQAGQMEQTGRIIEHYRDWASGEDRVYWELTADFGRAYSQMCLDWAKNSLRKLQQLEERK